MDNYDRWEAYDNMMQTRLERRPCCELCGQHIQQEYAVMLNDGYYCDRCLEDAMVPLDDD